MPIVVGILTFFSAILLIHYVLSGVSWAGWATLIFSGISAALALGLLINLHNL